MSDPESSAVETEGIHRIGIIGSDLEKQMVLNTPLGRFGQPEDYRAGRGVPGLRRLRMGDGRENYGVRRLSLRPRDTVKGKRE